MVECSFDSNIMINIPRIVSIASYCNYKGKFVSTVKIKFSSRYILQAAIFTTKMSNVRYDCFLGSNGNQQKKNCIDMKRNRITTLLIQINTPKCYRICY